jgi:CRP/FNR family transcriptional regulator, anaerobic regulatory protein
MVEVLERANARAGVGGGAHPRCLSCDVRKVAVCAAAGPEHLPRLAAVAAERELAAGQGLFEEGGPAEAVYVVAEGTLKLYKLMADGRRQVLGFMVPGDFLGLAFGRLHLCGAEAVTLATVCRIRRGPFLELLDECPALEKEILRRTTTELAVAQEQMLLLGRKTALERVASFLVGFARRRRLGPDEPVELPMGRADIADHLGLTVETVSRTFTRLRRMRLIDLVGTQLVAIRARARLEQVAGF